MGGQVKEMEGITKMTRIELLLDVHRKVKVHQALLSGKRGQLVTFANACEDLLGKATKHIKLPKE